MTFLIANNLNNKILKSHKAVNHPVCRHVRVEKMDTGRRDTGEDHKDIQGFITFYPCGKSADEEYLIMDTLKNELQLLTLNKPLECITGASHPSASGADSLHHPYQHHHLRLRNLHSLQANPLQETSKYCTAET
jgi:hypothetical protein